MATDQPGLRKRLDHESRRIRSQHRQLDVFFREIEAALARDAGAARQAFAGLRDALEAHFDVEERTEFPALHGFDPASDREIAALVDQHGVFRAALEDIHGLLRAGDLTAGRSEIGGLRAQMVKHEDREEALFARSTDRSNGPGEA